MAARAAVIVVDGGTFKDVFFATPVTPPIDPVQRYDFELGFVVDAGGGFAPSDVATFIVDSELRVEPVRVRSDESDVLLWWSDARELSYVELTEDGPDLPVDVISTHHGQAHPQRLVQQALRDVADRH